MVSNKVMQQTDPTLRPLKQRREASQKGRPATERTLLLLEALAAVGRPAALKELAGRLDMPAATAFRLCKRMEEEGFLVRDAGSRRYTIGVRLMRLGLDIVRASGPTSLRRAILSDVVEEIGETCNLTTLVGTDVLYLDRVETRWPLRVMFEPGSRVPVHCTASGKLLLAAMPDETRDRVLATLILTRQTDNTITDSMDLERELQRIKRRGYSTDDEEFVTGLACVAVPIKDRKGQVFAAIACHAPVARMNLEVLVAKVPRLNEAAERLARTFM